MNLKNAILALLEEIREIKKELVRLKYVTRILGLQKAELIMSEIDEYFDDLRERIEKDEA